MIILVFFAFLSGIVTIAAPCIWPLLPIVLASSATGGHKKPLGITVGICLSFGLLTLFLSFAVKLLGINANVLRFIAVIVISVLGVALIVPSFSSILEGLVSRISGKFLTPQSQQQTGFRSGLLSGIALGIVWTPCAGPILATIVALSATSQVSFALIFVALFYVIGVGIPLFIFASVGNKIFAQSKKLSPYTARIQQLFGVVMIATALLIATNQDVALEAKLLNVVPSYSQFLTNLESNPSVKNELNSLKNQQSPTNTIATNDLFNTNSPAPDFVGITHWLNLPAGTQALSLKDLKGKVVLVDFWTYTCINCIRTLPYVTSWYDKYKNQGFVVIGVHTPEFQFEHETSNVANAITMFHIHYPVAQDNNYATWNNYNNQYWPAEYLIDANGVLRRTHFGEGEYDQTEMAIQALLKEAGKQVSNKLETMPDQTPISQLSPETYVGSSRMEFYYPGGNTGNGTSTFSLSNDLPDNTFSLGGTWTIADDSATSGNTAVLNYNFFAQKVFLVLRPSPNGTSLVKVYLDGKQISAENAGADVKNGIVTVDSDRLYNLVDLHGQPSSHILKLEFQTPGTHAFAFTFG